MEDDDDHKELQLLPRPPSSQRITTSRTSDPSMRYRSKAAMEALEGPLDLQLSISVKPRRPNLGGGGGGGGGGGEGGGGIPNSICDEYGTRQGGNLKGGGGGVESLKWQAAEEIRMAAMEKAYAERVRELTRREMELAQSEFARARQVWERAREEVEKAERMKEMAMRQMDSTCMEITCQSCRQRFRP